ncbi:hypothetical protein CC86DRAFT_453766 [Ophiobolus disseminans]|uniref:Uncharacterized protein n=1 Tax=Ophiobolus disseminans TaxID=1469910 RepID=A0A6A7A6W1_9PLEO|nr:hypothetical protein CC86DRAFT_453766 [Ophiobolus disseminans]
MTKNAPTKALPLRAKPYDKNTTLRSSPQQRKTASTTLIASPTRSQDSTMAQNLGPQSDFDAIADNMRNMANIPAIHQDNQILAALNTLSNAMNAQFAAIKNRLTNIDNRLNGLDQTMTRTTANIHNNAAIVQNGRLFNGTQSLVELHDPTTNLRVPNFPQTGDALKGLNVNQLDTLIAALRMQYIAGNKDAKILVVKEHIGASFP